MASPNEQDSKIIMQNQVTMEPFIVGNSFELYEFRLKAFFKVNKIKEENQVDVLITVLPNQVVEKLIYLCEPDKIEEKKLEECLELLREFYSPKRNTIMGRFEFNQVKQEVNETIKEFGVRLKSRARVCEFGNVLDENLRDNFIMGLKDSSVQKMLLMESTKKDKLTFALAYSLATATELSELGAYEIRNQNAKYVVSQIDKSYNNRNGPQSYNNRSGPQSYNNRNNPQSYNNNRSNSQSYINRSAPQSYNNRSLPQTYNNRWNPENATSCLRCGMVGHHQTKCSANNFNCRKCGKKGHYEKVCRANAIKTIVPGDESYQEEDEYYQSNFNWIGALNNGHNGLFVEVLVDGQRIKMEIDTGACSSVMTYDKFKQIFPNKITSSPDSPLYTVTGQCIGVIGKSQVNVGLESDRREYAKLELVIIDTNKQFVPLLGRSWLDRLIPDWKKRLLYDGNMVAGINDKGVSDDLFLREMKEKFPNAFGGNSNDFIVGFSAEIHMKKDVVPIFCKPYSLPYPKKEQVEIELERLCKEGILIPIESSAWATPIVVAPKDNKEIRICMDCKVTINKYISNQYYPMPRIDDIFADLSGYKIYAKIDLKGAYLQLKMSETSRKYVTINTHKGLFQYTRLPFGVSSAPAIFQSTMEQIFKNIKGVKIYLDDILIGGKDKKELKENVLKVFEKLNKHHIKVNESKCEFFKEEVQYLGHIILIEGVKPNPKKIEAIKKAPCPKDVNQLRSYLGILNYYAHFIPNLSSKLNPLYKLLQKNIQFEWNDECNKIFEESKNYLMGNKVLELYDLTKPVIIYADASPYGYGAILAHVIEGVEKPVLFASCTLNDHERGYSQIHREAGAIMFAFHKFHKYVYGLKVTVISDHEPLKEIFSPDKCNSAVALGRLKRWSVILSMYEYEFKHRPGKLMGHVDALSRLPLNEASEFDEEYERDTISFVNGLSELPLNFHKLAEEQKQDEILNKVHEYVLKGWGKGYD